MQYFCCDDDRRDAVKKHATLNGIEFLEVSGDQRTLFVHFVKSDHLASLVPSNPLPVEKVRIEGGDRIRDISVTGAQISGVDTRVLEVTVDEPGDFSFYTLRLVDVAMTEAFDPILSAVRFSFKVDCPTDFDCKPVDECPPEAQDEPEIDYLAKDYASFRRLMLDRMTSLMPGWRERNPSDVGMALVEVLAYVADRLSYQQDAIATEAYLGTARKRTSVRRHARLVDYFVFDGSNARTWVHIRVKPNAPADGSLALRPLDEDDEDKAYRHRFLVRCGPEVATVEPDEKLDALLRTYAPEVFEPLFEHQFELLHKVLEVKLYPQHNDIEFYTWGARNCCLPVGATRATLKGDLDELKKGAVLIFEEVIGPRTGEREDADPAHRHAVRLIKDPVRTTDPLYRQDVTEIEWDRADALPFPLCISSETDSDHGGRLVQNVSLARGNIVLADHGLSITGEPLGTVPDPLILLPPLAADRCEPQTRKSAPPRFRPKLANAPLTQQGTVMVTMTGADGRKRQERAVFDPSAPAVSAFVWQQRDVVPAIALEEIPAARRWLPKRDLLNSDGTAEEFVVETENDLTATIRFGDDLHGARPAAGVQFSADYRVGNGAQGNVGADTLAHLVTNQPEKPARPAQLGQPARPAQPALAGAIESIRNLLPAHGGVEPESLEDVRKNAPQAFRVQERAVTAADYAEVTHRQADLRIQRAAATFRWTGSWHTVFVTADRDKGLPVDAGFETQLRDRLERYRMAGYDLEVDGPLFVPLEIEMTVCAKPDYFRSDVKAELLDVFSSRRLADGRLGVFHPDNFTFGQPVYTSRLYAAAMAVQGVDSVQITAFGRRGSSDLKPLDDGVLRFARLEIARLDNDPNFPERGSFVVHMQGGK